MESGYNVDYILYSFFLLIAVTPREKPNRLLSFLVRACATLACCGWA